MSRCINCRLNIRGSLRGHLVNSLNNNAICLFKRWKSLQQLNSDALLCDACHKIIEQLAECGDCDSQRFLGHLQVCFGCGCSLLHRRSPIRQHTIEEGNPTLNIIMSWDAENEVLTQPPVVCHKCWRRANRQLERDVRKHGNLVPPPQDQEGPVPPAFPQPVTASPLPALSNTQQSQKALLLMASLTYDFDYKYAIGEMCQLECKQFERNTVGKIKKEIEWGNEEGKEEQNDINIKEEEGSNTVEEIKTENVGVSEEGNEEEIDINIKEEELGYTETEIKMENVEVSEEGYEKENGINIKEEKLGYTETKIKIENVGVSEEEGYEEENDINIKKEKLGYTETEIKIENVGVSEEDNEEQNDINTNEEVGDYSDVGLGPPSGEGMLLKMLLERKIPIYFGASAKKRKLYEISQKEKQIKLMETTEDRETLINAASTSFRFSLPNNCKASDISYSQNLSVDMKESTSMSEQYINRTDNCYQESKISPKQTIQATNAIEENSKTLSFNMSYNKAENEVSKFVPKSTDAAAASTLLDGREQGSKSSTRKKRRSEKRFTCHICPFKCYSQSNLIVHIRVHTGEKPYACGSCDFRCAQKGGLDSHVKYKHTKEMKFSCHICQMKCHAKSALNAHLRTHTGEKPYTCDFCDYRCAKKSSVVHHIRAKHTKDKVFSCHICQFTCVKKDYLNKHLRIHTGDKPYSCNFCDYRTAQRTCLVNHIKARHTKEKNFSCHLCQYKCVGKNILTSHLRRTHTGDKPFACDLCDYKCAYKACLINHIKARHTKHKDFSCHLCQYKCVRKDSLTSHLRTHTGEKPYSCDMCDYRVAQKIGLINHIKGKHTK